MYWLPYSSYTSHHPSETPFLAWISYATQKTDARFMQDALKVVWSIPYVSEAAFFPSLKQNFIAYRSSKVSRRPDCIFEIHQLWQSGFSRVYYNCCCSCSFKPEIIRIGHSSHKMYSNNILNFQKSTIILNTCRKTVWKLIECTIYIYSPPQTDLFRSIRTHQCGKTVATHSWDWNPVWFKRQVEDFNHSAMSSH